MKKLLFLLLSLAVAATASAGFNTTPMQKKAGKIDVKNKVEKVTRGNGLIAPSTPIKFNGWNKFASHILRSDAAITWDFEDESQFAEFQALDNDGDGFNWQYFNNTGLETGRMTAYEGEGLIASASYDNDSKTALTPDNWLISPEVTLGGALSFWAAGQDTNYPAEKFGVYVCVGTPSGPADFVQIGTDFTATADFQQIEIDLSAYQGQVGHFAIVHHNITDMFWLNIDYITLDAGAVALPYPVVPENLTVNPGATTADVAWDNDEAAANWNLRYRPWTDLSGNPFFYDLTDLDQLSEWGVYDADGDGYGWGYGNIGTDDAPDYVFYSASYVSGQALTPDNYLLTPDVALGGVLKFTVYSASDDWGAEHMAVYVVYGEGDDDMALLTTEDIVANATPTEYEFDLSAYEGKTGYVIFRHYNCTDQYYLFLDNIFIGDPNAEIVEPAEWTYVNGLDANNYTIEGLTPDTKYEVQVMGYNEKHESDWCDIVEFTTLPLTPDVYILGEVGEKTWDPTDGLKMEYNAEDNIYTATVTFDGRGQSGENYFSFTTELAENNDDGGWAYIAPFRFGAVSEGDFWYDDQYDGQPLDLTYENYQAFRIMAGEYKLTVDLANMKLIIEKQAPEVMIGDVNMDGKVNIADVTALIDYLLSNDASLISLPNSNINGDTNINIADVTALIDMLLTN